MDDTGPSARDHSEAAFHLMDLFFHDRWRPIKDASARKLFRRRIDSAKFGLWVWARALRRNRKPRKRILAVWIAQALFGEKDRRRLDRKRIRECGVRRRRWHELRATLAERRGIPPTFDEVWDAYVAKYGPTQRVLESWPYAPREMREAISRVPDEEIRASDDFMRKALGLFLAPANKRRAVLLWCQACESAERLQAKMKLHDCAGSPSVNPQLGSSRLLLDEASYQIQVVEQREHATWFCFGCDEWHTCARGAPRRFQGVLMEMMRRAVDEGGVGRGDAKRIYYDVTAESEGAIPSLSWWYKSIRDHHLKKASDRRQVVFRDRRGLWRFSAWEPPPSGKVD